MRQERYWQVWRVSIQWGIRWMLYLYGMGSIFGQPFYFGADLSYVNEMEDCGAVFKENGTAADVYDIFARHGVNMARYRLWHTPSFYDTLNAGRRYSDFADVQRSILRAKAAGMDVLLDFHLSDFWADPGRQLIPAAWEPVADNLPALLDSLYQHVHGTLIRLHALHLLPELVQIGNETNRGILLTPADDAAGGAMQWPRNALLFNKAIQAVRDAERETGRRIRLALHFADPAAADSLLAIFHAQGVNDFDIIGLSYYWAWHKPVTIAQTGAYIRQFRAQYPGKAIMVFETGYVWTQDFQDQAANIISETHPDYHPASPQSQYRWLADLTQEVINQGGEAVMYWEPAWVSTPCRTPWGQGSHQEHATFFDFDHQVLPTGGMYWPKHPYLNLPHPVAPKASSSVLVRQRARRIELLFEGLAAGKRVHVILFDQRGQWLASCHQGRPSSKGTRVVFRWPVVPRHVMYYTACIGAQYVAGKIAVSSGG